MNAIKWPWTPLAVRRAADSVCQLLVSIESIAFSLGMADGNCFEHQEDFANQVWTISPDGTVTIQPRAGEAPTDAFHVDEEEDKESENSRDSIQSIDEEDVFLQAMMQGLPSDDSTAALVRRSSSPRAMTLALADSHANNASSAPTRNTAPINILRARAFRRHHPYTRPPPQMTSRRNLASPDQAASVHENESTENDGLEAATTGEKEEEGEADNDEK